MDLNRIQKWAEINLLEGETEEKNFFSKLVPFQGWKLIPFSLILKCYLIHCFKWNIDKLVLFSPYEILHAVLDV